MKIYCYLYGSRSKYSWENIILNPANSENLPVHHLNSHLHNQIFQISNFKFQLL
jgi:hypothetical protein